MDKLISAVSDWPVLVQGAIGSALFWLVLVFGQKIAAYASVHFATRSRKKRKSALGIQIFRYSAIKAVDPAEQAKYMSALWFRASRDLIKGLIWLALGLAFESVISILGMVGFFGCLYYLFAALEIVKPIDSPDDIDAEITRLKEELNRLKDA